MRPFLAFLALTALSAPAAAQGVLQVNGQGQLTGATGLTVGNLGTFDVQLVEGTCSSVFSGCDSNSDFAFNTQADATSASDAFLALIAGTAYDADPGLTYGCGAGVAQCNMITPYTVDAFTYVNAVDGINNWSASPYPDATNPYSFYANNGYDTSGDPGLVYARFTPSAPAGAVPEPATWALMLGGFGLAGAALRRRKPAAAFA